MRGAPCIRGLRIPVETIVRCFADGMSREEILRDYPDLEPEDMRAALEYSARSIDADPPPGVPAPPGGERPEDLLASLDGYSDEERTLLFSAAQAALNAGIEPGLRRARWIDGWLAGYAAAGHAA